MKIGIISDTHDHQANVLAAIKIFNDRQVEYVLHAGDMVSPFTAKEFAQLQAKLIVVLGNNEGEKVLLNNIMTGLGAELHPYAYKGTIGGKRIFMTHTDDYVAEAAGCGEYDLVIYGHTHKQDIRSQDGTLIINPGEATDFLSGQGQIVLLDLDEMTPEVIPLP